MHTSGLDDSLRARQQTMHRRQRSAQNATSGGLAQNVFLVERGEWHLDGNGHWYDDGILFQCVDRRHKSGHLQRFGSLDSAHLKGNRLGGHSERCGQ